MMGNNGGMMGNNARLPPTPPFFRGAKMFRGCRCQGLHVGAPIASLLLLEFLISSMGAVPIGLILQEEVGHQSNVRGAMARGSEQTNGKYKTVPSNMKYAIW